MIPLGTPATLSGSVEDRSDWQPHIGNKTQRCKLAVDASLNAMGSPSKALVAFTDVVKDAKAGQEYTEAKMNGFPEAATGDRFEADDYRFLIVACKFQTGFDQPGAFGR